MNVDPEPSTQPARVIHVPRRFVQEIWGGTETVILNLCRQQQARGETPEIHTSTALKNVREETWRDIVISRYPYFYTNLGLGAGQRKQFDLSGGNLVSPGLFRGLMRAKNVRMFHAHATNRLGSTVLAAARMRGVPCVTTIHGNVFDVPDDEAADRRHDQPRLFDWGKPIGLLLQTRRFFGESGCGHLRWSLGIRSGSGQTEP